MLPALAAPKRIAPAIRQAPVATGKISGNRSVTISRNGRATITSADGRLVETRNVPIDTSSLSLNSGLSEESKQALLNSLEGPAHQPFVPGVINVVLSDGTSSYQDKATFSNVSTTSVPQYTNDSRVNAIFAKYGVTQVTRIARSVSRSKLAMMRSRAMGRDRAVLNLASAFQVRITSGTVQQAVRELLKQPSVSYASPDWIVSTTHVGVHSIPATAMPQLNPFAAATRSVRVKSSAMSVSQSNVPGNYGISTSLESWMNAPGVDAVAAYDEIATKFGQLPGQGEIITNVSIGDVCANGRYVTSHLIGGQHYIDVPSMPLIPEYVADGDANLSGQTEVCGVDPSDGEIMMDFSVMAPLPKNMQRAGATGSGATDMLGIAPGAQYRLVVPGSDFSASGLVAAFIAAADQTPNPNVITASLGWGLDAYGFPSRYLEEDPLMRSVISTIVNADNIVVCISAGDGLRTYTNAAVNPMGGSVPTNLAASANQQTDLNDVSNSTAPSSVVDTGAIDVGGTTVDDILAANPADPANAQYVNQLAWPEVRWDGFRSFSSGFGSRVNVSAPSDNIPVMSFNYGTSYNKVVVGLDGGTSASAPMTAAAAAVMLQVARLTGHPFATATDVRAHLISTAVPVPNVPQADMQINVGPQINVRRGVEKLLANAGTTLAPSLGRVAIAQHRMFNGATACTNRGYSFQFPEEDMFVEATDPTYIRLDDKDGCQQPAARNLNSPITIAPDWEAMPANARYKLYIAGQSNQVLATTPWARLYPQQIFQAAGLPITSTTPRTITLTYEVDAGLHMVASKTFDITFSAAPTFSLTLAAPIVAPVIDSTQLKPCTLTTGSCFTATYDFSSIPANYYNNPVIEVSYPGRTTINGYYFTAWTSPILTQPKGTVEIPVNALPGSGIYGLTVNRWPDPTLNFFGLQAYGQTGVTRLVAGSSARPAAPLISLPSDAAANIAPSHGRTVPYGGSFIVSWDVSNVPNATNATLEISAPGPNFAGNYNPFNNPNGSVVDNNGHDTGSTFTFALPSTKGTMTFTAAQANLVPAMGQMIRVVPQNGTTGVGEASDESSVSMSGLLPIAPLSLIHGFAINPNGDDAVFSVDGLLQSVGPDTGSLIGTFSQTNQPNKLTIRAQTYVGDPYTVLGYVGGGRVGFQQGAVSQADSNYGYDTQRAAALQATAVPGGSWRYLKQYYPTTVLPPGYDVIEAGRNMSTTVGPIPILARQYVAATGAVNYGLFFWDTVANTGSTFVPIPLATGFTGISAAHIDYDPAANTAYVLATMSKCSFFGCTFDDYIVSMVNPSVNPLATPTSTEIGQVGNAIDFELDPVNHVAAFTSTGPNPNNSLSTLNVVNLSGPTPALTTVNIPTSFYDYTYLTTKIAMDPVHQYIAVQNPVPQTDDTDNNPLSEIDFYDYTGHFVKSTSRYYNFKSYTLGDHWFQLNPGTRTMFVTPFTFDDIIPVTY
jgi:hypothetical protein